MLTVPYDFYETEYNGVRDLAEFNRLAPFASAYIGEITCGRVPDNPDDLDNEDTAMRVKLAFCSVLDLYGDQEPSNGIASETNDGISVSYVTDAGYRRQALYNAAAIYLGITGLLYRGVS